MKSARQARRIVSGVFLFGALLMLVLGVTFLSNRLGPVVYILYWLVCFFLTGMAALIALADMALLRREQRKAQQELIAETLREAQLEKARNRPNK